MLPYDCMLLHSTDGRNTPMPDDFSCTWSRFAYCIEYVRTWSINYERMLYTRYIAKSTMHSYIILRISAPRRVFAAHLSLWELPTLRAAQRRELNQGLSSIRSFAHPNKYSDDRRRHSSLDYAVDLVVCGALHRSRPIFAVSDKNLSKTL